MCENAHTPPLLGGANGGFIYYNMLHGGNIIIRGTIKWELYGGDNDARDIGNRYVNYNNDPKSTIDYTVYCMMEEVKYIKDAIGKVSQMNQHVLKVTLALLELKIANLRPRKLLKIRALLPGEIALDRVLRQKSVPQNRPRGLKFLSWIRTEKKTE